MAKVKRSSWNRYSARQAAQREAAAAEMMAYSMDAAGKASVATIAKNGTRIAIKHGRAAAALACVWYDKMAAEAKVDVQKADPVVVANSGRIAAQVNDATRYIDAGDVEAFAKECGDAVAGEVKRSVSRTMMKNARRDQAEFAWVPQGSETCAFCEALASNGWTPARRETAMGDHNEHIHPNCECEFAVRFNGEDTIAGYDEKVEELREKYRSAEGKSSKAKINSMRRDNYAKHQKEITARQRENYAIRKDMEP